MSPRPLSPWRALAHFLGAGALLFAATRLFAPDPAPLRRVIEVPAERIAAGTVEPWLSEEILVREALARGMSDDAVIRRRLAANLAFVDATGAPPRRRSALEAGLLQRDPVIRRRLAQRMRFVLEAAADPTPPSAAEVDAYAARNPEPLQLPATVRFEQIFFDPQRRGARSESDAAEALRALRATELPDPAGDAAPFSTTEPASSLALERRFGQAFAAAAMQAPLGVWTGPLRSTLGVHLIRVLSRSPQRTADVGEVGPRLRAAIHAERRAAAFAAGLERLRQRYEIRSADDP